MSGPWDRYATAPAAAASAGPWAKYAAAPQAQGVSDAVANAFGQGATLNAGDEIAAGIRALAPDFSNWMMRGPELRRAQDGPAAPQTVSTAPTVGQRYDEELAKVRAQTKADAAENPNLMAGANIAGNVASTVAALPAAATAAGPSLLVNMLKTGATGAALGGAAGFGEGEGGFDKRVTNAIVPAAVGGALGGAMPFVGATGRWALENVPGGRFVTENVVSPVSQKIASLLGSSPKVSLSAAAPDGTAGVTGENLFQNVADKTRNVAQTGAIDRLATMLQRSKVDPVKAEARLAQLGDESMLADLGPEFASTTRALRSLPGETKTTAKTAIEGRANQEPRILRRAFEGDQPPPSRYDLMGDGKAYDQYLRSVGARVYGDMEAAGLKQTPELMALYENPHVAKAIDNVMTAEKSTRIGTDRAPSSPVEIMHKVKQAIWDLGFDAATARPGPNASWYRDLGIEYMNKLKAANPALKTADAQYSAAAKLPEFFDAGHKFLSGATTEAGMNSSAPALGDLLMGSDPLQRLSTRAGTTNAVREMTGGRNSVGNTRAIARDLPAEGIVPKIEQIYDPAQARNIQQAGDTIRTYADTHKTVLGGSQSDINLLTAADNTGNAGFRISPGEIKPRLWESVRDVISKVTGPNEAVRDEIGRAMLNMDPSEKRRLLALAAELMKTRAQGAPISSGLIESAASQSGAQR